MRTAVTTVSAHWYPPNRDRDRDQYEKDLQRRQEEHLRNILSHRPHRPCLHDGCPECQGTGVRRDGTLCVHAISCPCPTCTPYC